MYVYNFWRSFKWVTELFGLPVFVIMFRAFALSHFSYVLHLFSYLPVRERREGESGRAVPNVFQGESPCKCQMYTETPIGPMSGIRIGPQQQQQIYINICNYL